MASKIETLEVLSKVEFAYLTKKEYEPLTKAGFAEINPEIVDGNKVATRITEAGKAELASFNSSEVKPEVKPEVVVYAIETGIPMPESKRKGGAGRPSKYPFESLTVGQMFFVPATKEQPDPAKTLGSVVTSANKRYATPVEGKTKANRKGVMVPVLEYQRKFVLKPYNKMINDEVVHGAGVWREK